MINKHCGTIHLYKRPFTAVCHIVFHSFHATAIELSTIEFVHGIVWHSSLRGVLNYSFYNLKWIPLKLIHIQRG